MPSGDVVAEGAEALCGTAKTHNNPVIIYVFRDHIHHEIEQCALECGKLSRNLNRPVNIIRYISSKLLLTPHF